MFEALQYMDKVLYLISLYRIIENEYLFARRFNSKKVKYTYEFIR